MTTNQHNAQPSQPDTQYSGGTAVPPPRQRPPPNGPQQPPQQQPLPDYYAHLASQASQQDPAQQSPPPHTPPPPSYGPQPPNYGPPQWPPQWPPQAPAPLPPYPGLQPQWPTSYYYGPPQAKNGLGISSFVLGIVSIVIVWIPFVWMVTLPVSLTGLGLGLGNLMRLHAKRAHNPVLTWIGVGLSAAATLIAIFAWALLLHNSQ